MRSELVVGNSLAAFELLDSTPDFRIDGLVVLGKPAILLLLSFEQAELHLSTFAEPVAWRCFLIQASRAASWTSMFITGSLCLVEYAPPASQLTGQ